MAELGLDFNHEEVPPSEFDPLPAGTYIVEVVESDVVVPSSGKGKMMKLTLQVVEGEYANRKIFENINYQHENEKTQTIGQRTLADLCAACGIRGPLHDTESLHGIPVQVRLIIREDEKYGRQNATRGYKPRDGSNVSPSPGKAQGGGASTAKAGSSGAGKKLPWQKDKPAETATT